MGVILLALVQPLGGAASGPQSLAEVARKEAERRQKLAQQGVQEKRIEASDPAQLAPGGTISLSSPDPRPAPARAPATKAEPRASLRSFQTRLQKLDRDIVQAEDRLKLLRARLEAERWAPIKTAKGSKGSASSAGLEQLRWQIVEQEGKLARLRQDRSDTFQAGRKAGYLPGELEGRGIMR